MNCKLIMGKRLVFIVTTLLIAGIAAGWYFFARESKDFGTSPLKAVPIESPYFIRIRNLGDFAEKTVRQSGWESIRNLKGINPIFEDFVFLDSLFRQNKASEDFLRHQELVVVPIENTKLYLLQIGSIAEKNNILSFVKDYFLSRNIAASTEKYKNCLLHQYEWIDRTVKRRIFFSYCRGIIMFVNEPGTLKRAIDQMDQPSILENPDFLRINKNSTENIDLNIYINHKTVPGYLADYFSDSLACKILQKNYARWSEVDLIQKESQWLMNGFTICDSTTSNFLNIFKHQSPIASSLIRNLPSNTSFFVLQNLSNQADYFSDYCRYLRKNGTEIAYNELISGLSKVLQLNFGQYLTENWAGEVGVVYTNQNLEDKSDNRFFLIKVKSERNDPLLVAVKKWTSASNEKQDAAQILAAKSNIWKVPINNFGLLFGESCFSSVQTNWMTVGDGFILMGSTPGSLERYKNLLLRNEILEENPSYQKYASGQANTCNFFMWGSPGLMLSFIQPVLQPIFYQSLSENLVDLNKLENFSWQWGYENGVVFNSATISVNPKAQPNRIPFWRFPLKAGMRNNAFFVAYSAKSSVKDLVFQDADNSLIDLDYQGSERWRVNLDGAIMGGIKVIELTGNGEFQLLFNTSNAIHLIDKRGNEVKNFPVKLKAAATNEVAVFDYDGKRDYRYLVACNDHKIYNFDKYGKVTLGWQNRILEGIADFPVQHFRTRSKDYLLFFDKYHTYLLDRQGKERVKIQKEFVHSRNNISLIKSKEIGECLVTTDEHGKIQLIGINGSVRKIDCGNFTKVHYFYPVDLSEDGNINFLFIDNKKLTLYDFSGKVIFSRELDVVVDQGPGLIQFGDEKLIKLNSMAENRTILVRKDGSFFNKFPPDNSILRSVGCFTDQNSVLNVITTTGDRFLVNYQVFIK